MPNTRPALAAFEWLLTNAPAAADRFAADVFHAYFAEGRDIESAELLDELAGPAGLGAAFATAEPERALARSAMLSREHAVTSTPTWIAPGARVSGLRPRRRFAQWAAELTG